MGAGTCDPASRGELFNLLTLSMGNGNVTADIRYGWDGISTKESVDGCNGPLYQPPNQPGNQADRWAIKVINNDTISWWVRTIGKRGQPRNVEFLPGTTVTFTVNQASNAGYLSIQDFSELTLSTSPTSNQTRRA